MCGVHNEAHTSCLIDNAKLKPRQQNEGLLSLDATNTQHLRPLSTLNMVNNHCHKTSYSVPGHLTPDSDLELDNKNVGAAAVECSNTLNNIHKMRKGMSRVSSNVLTDGGDISHNIMPQRQLPGPVTEAKLNFYDNPHTITFTETVPDIETFCKCTLSTATHH